MFVVFLHHFFSLPNKSFSLLNFTLNEPLSIKWSAASFDWEYLTRLMMLQWNSDSGEKKTNWIHPRYTEPHAECLFFYSFNYYIFWVNHSAEQQWYMLVSRTHTSGGENEAIVCVCNLIVLRDFSDANSCNTWFDWVYDMTTVYLQNLFYVSIKINEPNVLSTFYISVWSAQPIR